MWDAQLDIFGREHSQVNARTGTQDELFTTIKLDDPTYAGTVEQETLDGRTVRHTPDLVFAIEDRSRQWTR